MDEPIREYPVKIEIPIPWGDMDAFQHVNNIKYFKYFESARIAYFEEIKFLEVMEKTGIGPILASTQCRYKLPLTYPDQVTVGARVDSSEKDRFTMKYAVFSNRHNKVAATGEGPLVTFDYHNNRKTPVPDAIRKNILDLEKNVRIEL